VRLEITRKTHLALRVVVALASSEDRMKGADLAKTVGTSKAFLAQVVTPLVRQGWIESEPGRSGGYSGVADPKDVSVLELIEAVEGPTENDICALRGGACSSVEKCAVHDAWIKTRRGLMDQLAATPIATLARQGVLR
jgi:Rrf2 family protein